MPGFMGIRGLESKNPHDMGRERRNEQRQQPEMRGHEQRSREKVQEILQDQEGDMSAYRGHIGEDALGDCANLSREKVTRIMSSRVAVLSFDDTLLTVQGIFASVKFRHLPVVDDRGGIIGIISDRDFLRVVSPFFGTVNEQNRDKEIMTRRVGTIMTRNPFCAGVDTSIIDAVRLMNQKKISCLPIVKGEEKTLLGIITWKDVVRLFCPAAFASNAESNRLKTGVRINSENSESARLRARAAESARLRARPAENPAPPAQPSPPPPQAKRHSGDTRRIQPPGPALHVSPEDKLRPSSAGQAGSVLADKQRQILARNNPGSERLRPPDERK